MTQLKSLEALLKVKEGFVDLDQVVADDFLPPKKLGAPMLCRVQTGRNGGVFWTYVEVDDALGLMTYCEARGLMFAGIYGRH